ncbi:DNA ligase III [Mameliella alba]|uniref:RNA ligase family protein n=1 Tax=Mameliella alba TaxID=561184 RepID=UPI0013E4AEC4|nr:RNA ligase family protein [Mameliella alba]BBU56662.1 DNA ligase III [Mameliella alba]
MDILKYPRTRHLEGSRLQVGDLADDKPLKELAGESLVVEEKLDGANCAVSFDASGNLLLQSRGHYLTGGGRERHFGLFKTWASVLAPRLHARLDCRFVMYGEWMLAKHTQFYDALPHYFMEFDVFDRETGVFLSTEERRNLLSGLPIMPVPVLHVGELRSVKQVESFIKPSLYRTPGWEEALERAALASGSRLEMVGKQTEKSDLAEGLYVKLEREGVVAERYKYVRAGFKQAIEASEGHWHDRPILENGLAEGVDIFAACLGLPGAYDGEGL